MKRRWFYLVLLGVVLVLSACAPGTEEFVDREAGFFFGIWHGWIAPISIIWHIFDDSVRIYEVNNTGIWYDVGFYIAVISGFGGISLSRGSARRKRKKKD